MSKPSSRACHRRPLLAALITAGLFAGSPASVWAADDSDRIRELERKLERSLQLIGELSDKVRRLEAGKTAIASDNTAVNRDERLDALEKQVSLVSASTSMRRPDEGLPLHGFFDVGFNVSEQSNTQNSGPKGFGVGSFDLYITPHFGDRMKSLVELLFEVEESGKLHTDLERVQLGYTFSDAATLWVGRVHTPFGYWNTGFHHGAQIQTSILRPKFLNFEDDGGIMPSHLTGLWLTGNVRAGEGKVNYDLYAGNGPRLDIDPDGTGSLVGKNSPSAGGDDNHQAFVGFNLGYAFADGLRAGVHGFRGAVNDTSGNRTDVGMGGMYGTYLTEDWEILSEYYRFRNTVEALAAGGTVAATMGDTRTSNAWFAQAGRHFGQWTPFIRAERAALDQNDPYFFYQASGLSYSRQAVGLRYDLNASSALKVELNSTRINGKNADGTVVDSYPEARTQWSVRF